MDALKARPSHIDDTLLTQVDDELFEADVPHVLGRHARGVVVLHKLMRGAMRKDPAPCALELDGGEGSERLAAWEASSRTGWHLGWMDGLFGLVREYLSTIKTCRKPLR